MTDGTTGIQVAPITEDEMGKVHDILRRAADAIVGMSQLKHDVDQLSTQVRQLSDDCERLRKANAGLEESLYQARNHRQELESRLAEAEQAKVTVQRECSDWQSKASSLDAENVSLRHSIDQMRQDLDDALGSALEFEAKYKQVKSVLDKYAEVHTSFFGKAPEPAPTEASPAPAPEPTPTEPAPAPVSEEVDWSRPYHWDSASSRYVND